MIDAGGAPWWLTPAISLVLALLGAGGLSSFLKVRADRRLGVAQQDVAEDDALSNRWKAIIEAQTKSLLEPLQTRLKDVEATVTRLELELADSRRKYWNAIAYIRTLLIWINRHMPEHVEQTAIPEPTATIAEDI